MADIWFRSSSDKHVGRALPIAYERKGVPGALFVAAFGLIFGGFPLAALLAGAAHKPSLLLFLIVLLFAVFGFGCLALGVSLHRSAEILVIDNGIVSYRQNGPFVSASWEEPLTSYRGVLVQESAQSRHSGPNDLREIYTLYQVILRHSSDRKRDVELFRSESASSAMLESEAEGFSKLLNAVLLREKDGGGYEERAPGDLDESLRQRAREGKVEVHDPGAAPEAAAQAFDQPSLAGQSRVAAPGGPPGDSLRWEREDGGERLTMPLGQPVFALIGAGLLTVGALVTAKASIILGAGFFLLGLIFSFVGWATEVLHVGSEEVRQEYLLFGFVVPAKNVAKDAIKDVIVFREQHSSSASVRLICDREQLVTGQGVSDAERRWLKELLTARLAR